MTLPQGVSHFKGIGNRNRFFFYLPSILLKLSKNWDLASDFSYPKQRLFIYRCLQNLLLQGAYVFHLIPIPDVRLSQTACINTIMQNKQQNLTYLDNDHHLSFTWFLRMLVLFWVIVMSHQCWHIPCDVASPLSGRPKITHCILKQNKDRQTCDGKISNKYSKKE